VPLLALVPSARANSAPRSSQTAYSAIPSASALIDVNHCSADELLAIPGMTRVWANRIVRPYRTKADLEEQGVIPADLYSRIKDSIIAHRSKQ
jgi:DNA uptake protein ComE-like DNA-binding protein